MGIGASVFLLAVGAILAFAVDAAVGGVDLDLIGIILMAAGGLGLLIALAVASSSRGDVVDEHVVEERHDHR